MIDYNNKNRKRKFLKQFKILEKRNQLIIKDDRLNIINLIKIITNNFSLGLKVGKLFGTFVRKDTLNF